MAPRLQQALERLLDAVVDPRAQATVRRLFIEAERAFAAGHADAFLAVLEDLGRSG